jgi:hypothetical protein
MQKVADLRSPLTVIYMTIVLLTIAGALIMVTVALEWLPPVWSHTVLVLQGAALLVVLMAYHWRPSWRLWLYPLLVGYMTLLWTMTPSSRLTEAGVHVSLPLALLAGIVGDIVLTQRQSLPFTPRRISVHGGYVNFDEASYFFRVPPDVLRLHFDKAGRPIHEGGTRQEYVVLKDLLAVLAGIQEARPGQEQLGTTK